MTDTPKELQVLLVDYFPDFQDEFEESDSDYGYSPQLTYHEIWMSFSPIAHGLLTASTEDVVRSFSGIVSDLVRAGGDKENAVSTCFLEHASQLGVRTIIQPYLSKEAKDELR